MSAKKFLIIGAKGMLGRELAVLFRDRNIYLWDREEINIADEKDVGSKIRGLKPDIVINAAAYTDVDGCETKQDLAFDINGRGVGYLAKVCHAAGAIFIHYSTDYVFDGKSRSGYFEDDKPENPPSIYGQSKLLGEKLLLENTDMFYLIRLSWLFGRYGNNFVETMIKLAGEKSELKVVNDQFGKPTYAYDLALKTKELIDGMNPCGIYHITNETKPGGISWHEFAAEIFRLKNIKTVLTPCSSREFIRPAKRPAYSALINSKLPQVRDWEEALAEYLRD